MGCLKLTYETNQTAFKVIRGGKDLVPQQQGCFEKVDYYAYGENLMGREFNGNSIKFGFNNKMNDVESGYQDYGMRMSSSKRRSFVSVDPLAYKYAELTPYQFASNSPISNLDVDGLESLYYTTTIDFITNHQVMPDGSSRAWSTQEISNDGGIKTGLLYSNGALGSGTLYTVMSVVKERWYDANGIFQSDCAEEPTIIKNVYQYSDEDVMKIDITKRPMHKGAYQLLVFGRGEDNSESPGSLANPNATTETINMEAWNEIIEPLLLGRSIKESYNNISEPGYEPPSLSDIVNEHAEKIFEKADKMEELNTKGNYPPNTTVCSMCNLPPHPQTGTDAYEINSRGRVKDTLRKNSNGGIDTIPTQIIKDAAKPIIN